MANALRWKVGTKVYDRWWPWKTGVVIRTFKTTVHVRWVDGSTQRYDAAHWQFLEEL